MATYKQDIPSVHSKNPAVPEVLGLVDTNLDLSCAVKAGDALDRDNLRQAQAAAYILRQSLGQNNDVTVDLVESAELRAVVIQSEHAQAQYGSVDLMQAILALTADVQVMRAEIQVVKTDIRHMKADLQDVKADVRTLKDDVCLRQAEATNTRILTRNHIGQLSHQALLPLQKTVSGTGHDKAHAVLAGVPAATCTQYLQFAAANLPEPQIGSLPNIIINPIEQLNHLDILKLIYFYNADFGIMPADILSARIKNLQTYLTSL